MTEAGTVASEISLLARFTVTAAAVSVLLRVTVAVVAAAPAFSAMAAAAIAIVTVSKSVTSTVSVTSKYPEAVPVMMTVCVPSSKLSSMASIEKLTAA